MVESGLETKSKSITGHRLKQATIEEFLQVFFVVLQFVLQLLCQVHHIPFAGFSEHVDDNSYDQVPQLFLMEMLSKLWLWPAEKLQRRLITEEPT